MRNKPALQSFGHAVLVLLYISGVAWIMTSLEKITIPDKSVWIPIMMLMLLVLSVAVMGALVLGRPILLYLAGAKSEAIKFFGYTIGWLAAIVITILLSYILR